MTSPEFGERETGAVYVERPGAYALALDPSGRLLAVRAKGKLFLPGGGIEAGESHAEALVREVLEETGWRVVVRGALGVAVQHARSLSGRGHYRKIEHYYAAELVRLECAPSEADHAVEWTPVSAATLFEEAQRWALERLLGQRPDAAKPRLR